MTFLFLVGICLCILHVNASKKSGLCPPEPRIRGELATCKADSDCPGERKCCFTVKGRECVTALDNADSPLPSDDQCPPTKPKISGKWVDLCGNHGNCPGLQKCCATELGNRCMDLSGKTSSKKGMKTFYESS
ncbi:WAP domain containing protein, SLPI-like [Trichuris trichiura]|uniref:WAP domain containing protein, SLPI-like n=1 Tax=Trichuris trichiura TaxID=36087 RepID=A0A077ZDD4_TRITR|nr:WAP domain containing protein, SLPI-like [Trichuris trichiura]